MAKPWVHAMSSAKRYGGIPEDYLKIHDLMDSSKAVIADSRHRALTHNSWFVGTILEKVFGNHIVNSDGKRVSVRQIGEDHVMEDFSNRFIPAASDYLNEMEYKGWMQNGRDAVPPSFEKIQRNQVVTRRVVDLLKD
jgi:hypothetical protein